MAGLPAVMVLSSPLLINLLIKLKFIGFSLWILFLLIFLLLTKRIHISNYYPLSFMLMVACGLLIIWACLIFLLGNSKYCVGKENIVGFFVLNIPILLILFVCMGLDAYIIQVMLGRFQDLYPISQTSFGLQYANAIYLIKNTPLSEQLILDVLTWAHRLILASKFDVNHPFYLYLNANDSAFFIRFYDTMFTMWIKEKNTLYQILLYY